MNESLLGLQTENLRHQFRGAEAQLRLDLDNGITIQAVWPELDEDREPVDSPFFYIVRKGQDVTSTRPGTLRGEIGAIGVIPTLNPIQHDEEVLERDYVERSAGTPRTAQHFRNHIYHIYPDGDFDLFREWVLAEVSEIDRLGVEARPGKTPGRMELDVYYRERGEHSEREVCGRATVFRFTCRF